MALAPKKQQKTPITKKKVAPDKPKKEAPKKIDKGVAKVLEDINNKYGANTISIGVPDTMKIQRIRTGSVRLDLALGGGIPCGRYTEIEGALSSTKTTQSLHILKNAQAMGKNCAFIDVEATSTEDYMREVGVDVDNLLYANPESSEEATQMILDLQMSGAIQLVVLDSIAAMSPKKIIENGMEDSVQMAAHAALLGRFFNKYQMNNNGLVRRGNEAMTLIATNQLRERPGAYGDPEYSPGGRTKGFVQSVNIKFRYGDTINEGTSTNKRPVGRTVKFNVVKNKTYKPRMTGEFNFYTDADNKAGIPKFHNDVYEEVILACVQNGIIDRRGGWFYFGDEKYQGVDSVIDALKGDHNLVEQLEERLFNEVLADAQ